MKKSIYSKICILVFILTGVFHFVWSLTLNKVSIGIESYFIIIIPYLLPIFINVYCLIKKKYDIYFLIIVGLIYFIMFFHVTIYGILCDFIYGYFDFPIIYGIILSFITILYIMKINKPNKQSIVCKILYYLCFVNLLIMICNSGFILYKDWLLFQEKPLSSSAPWWIMSVGVASVYLCIELILVFLFFILKRKNLNNE